jgi:hypothetical protein
LQRNRAEERPVGQWTLFPDDCTRGSSEACHAGTRRFVLSVRANVERDDTWRSI